MTHGKNCLMIVNASLMDFLLQRRRFEKQSTTCDGRQRILRTNQRKRPMKLVDSRMFWVCGGNFELNRWLLDSILSHFNVDASFVGMSLIAAASLIGWLVAIVFISSSKVDISTEEKPFSLSFNHDNSIIAAYVSSFVVAFLAACKSDSSLTISSVTRPSD